MWYPLVSQSKVFLPSMTAQADGDFSQPVNPFSHGPSKLATCYNWTLFTAPGNMNNGEDWRLGQAGDNFRDKFQTLATPWYFGGRSEATLASEKSCQVTGPVLLPQTHPTILAEAGSLFFSNSNCQEVIPHHGSKSFKTDILKIKFRDWKVIQNFQCLTC